MYQLIKINEKEYKVRLNLNALSEFKILNNNIGVVGLLADLQRGHFTFDIEEAVKLFYVGVKHGGDPYDKTLLETREMFEKAYEEEGFGFIDDVTSSLLMQLTEGKKKKPTMAMLAENEKNHSN